MSKFCGNLECFKEAINIDASKFFTSPYKKYATRLLFLICRSNLCSNTAKVNILRWFLFTIHANSREDCLS